MFGLMEDSWILILYPIFFLQCIILVEVYKENLASYRYVVEKGKTILIGFLDNYGYSLILH